MAPVPASLTINFTSNYPVGVHRVCYRIAGTGSPYTCVPVTCTPFVPPAGPSACSINIPITVDNETCDPVTYEGYVQATCEAESSLAGREPFSITFTPNPTCIGVEYRCNNVDITSITIVNGGTGYDPMSPPTVTAIGGGGTAVLTAVVDGSGVITGITIVSSSGYASTPLISIDPPPGPGTQATATAILNTCPQFTLGTNCSGTAKGTMPALPAGKTFITCYTGGLAGAPAMFPNRYTRSQVTDCCYECKVYTVTSLVGTQSLIFSDCTNNRNTTSILINAGDPPSIICAVEGSVVTSGSSTIVAGASC